MALDESLFVVVRCRLYHGAGGDFAARRYSGGYANAGVRVGTEVGGSAYDDRGGGTARRLCRADFGSYQEVIRDISRIVMQKGHIWI